MADTTKIAETVARLRRVSLDIGIPSTTRIDSARVREIADLIEALAARLAEVGAIADRQLELSGDAYHDMKARAEAAETALARAREEQDAMVGAAYEAFHAGMRKGCAELRHD